MKDIKKLKKDNSTKDDYFIYCRSRKCGKFIKPDWVGKEISFDNKYLNCNLAICPFNSW